MNAKTAKRLRKECNYHPTQEREYEIVNKSRKIKDLKTKTMKHGTLELHAACSRYMYQQAKKEL
jgi:hypothetical protein